MKGALVLGVAVAGLAASVVDAFSLPGVQMTTYKTGERMPVFVNSLTSAETLLPLDYYKLPLCQVPPLSLHAVASRQAS
jgi:hypothetical protein